MRRLSKKSLSYAEWQNPARYQLPIDTALRNSYLAGTLGGDLTLWVIAHFRGLRAIAEDGQ